MTSEIPISDLDWWKFNMGESGYREKKRTQHRLVSKSMIWELEYLGYIPSPGHGLLSFTNSYFPSFLLQNFSI